MQGVDYASVDENKSPDVKAANVSFAIVRGSYCYGGKTLRDKHMTRDRDAWAPARFGSYMIIGWGTDDPPIDTQVAGFVAAYGKRRPGELPPGLDVEFSHGRAATGLSAEEALKRCERALTLMQSVYGCVMTYTSARVWHEDLGDLDSRAFSTSPLWVKTPYVYKAGNPPHPEVCPEVGELPAPWRAQSADCPGVWIQQYQGDAKAYPGFTSTVDCNKFLTRRSDAWVRRQLARYNCSEVLQLQAMYNLTLDGIVGPTTFAYLTA